MFRSFLLCFALSISMQLSSQSIFTAIGGCTTAEAVSGLPTNFEVDLWAGPFQSINYVQCKATLNPAVPHSAMRPRYTLQRFDQNSGNWLSHAGPQNSPKFTNLPHGTFRIIVVSPTRFTNIECQEGFDVYNTGGQRLGWWGTYTNGATSTSNAVVVGKTVSSDIAYHFVDGGGGDILPNADDFGQIVTMNASASKNYDLFWLAIFENTSPFRYGGQGWSFTNAIGGVGSINLTQKAAQFGIDPLGFPGTFAQYTVQFAIENKACINESWTNSDQVFTICPSDLNLNCRFGQPSLEAPKLSPNPSLGSLQVSNLTAGEYQIKVVDLSGRLIDEINFRAGEEITLEGISAGMYVASIWHNGVRVHTEKLIINL
jgi:hypothetical protein